MASHGISASTQGMLDEMRKKMLYNRRGVSDSPSSSKDSSPGHDEHSKAESMRTALFEGRAVNVQRLEPNIANPAMTDQQEFDPHRLFQMLRKKKRNVPSIPTGNSPMKATVPKPHMPPQPPQETAPTPPGGESTPEWWGGPPPGEKTHSARDSIHQQRHANSARPAAPKRPGSSIRDRSEVHSATVGSSTTPDGRPATRQKHPKMSLDLFSSPAKQTTQSSFPPKRRVSSGSLGVKSKKGSGASLKGSTSHDRLSPQNDDQPNAKVDFACLFFNSDDELEANEEFPAARAQVDIPLIETDWFTTDSFETLPTSDGVEQLRDEEGLDGLDGDSPRYAESLYGMLVARSSRRGSSSHH